MGRNRHIWLAAAVALAVALRAAMSSPAMAESQPDAVRLLKSVSAYEQAGCAHVKISFTRDIDLKSKPAASEGDELHFVLSPRGGGVAAVERQALSPPVLKGGAIHAIELDPADQGGDLALYFRRSVAYAVSTGANARSLIIGFATDTAVACPAEFDEAAAAPGDKSRLEVTAAEEANAANIKTSNETIAAARKALAEGLHDTAASLARKILDAGDTVHQQEATELLALAYEAKGWRAEAAAGYQSYLARYPEGEGSARVKQRLVALGATPKDQVAKLVVSSAGADAKPNPATPASETPSPGKFSEVTDAKPSKERLWDTQAPLPEKDPDAWTIGYFGSISTYYERNQGGRDYYLAPILNQGWEKDRIDQVYQNSFLSGFDFETHFERHGFAGRIRVAGSQETTLIDGDDGEKTVSAFYYDAAWKEEGYATRFGRQSRFTGGVLGRFDGALASVQVSDQVKVNAVAGSPVERSANRPFLDDRYFYGVSADIVPSDAGKDFTVFFIDQRSEGLIDRQGIGAEAHLTGDAGTFYASSDFDVHYHELNSMLISATHNFDDKTVLSANFDFRRSPLVFTTNALQGQGVATLSELLAKYSLAEIETIALDRSAKSYTATLGFTQPITEHLLYSLDGTWTYLSATEGSAGIGPSAATGIEFYGLAQLTASDVLAEGDSFSTGLRYDDTDAAMRYMLELSSRYPLSESWRLTPMLRLGLADYKFCDCREYQIMPTLRASYLVTSDIVVDFELGKKWLKRDTVNGRENEDELVVLTGLRYDFHSD